MREYALVFFEVKKGKVGGAKAAIKEFISQIRRKEPGTLFYSSLQESERPGKFAHFMIFTDRRPHEHHRNTSYLEGFVKKLYPLCMKEPEAVFLKEFDSCGIAADILKKRK
jgi:quinol monooxygenase YgiN